MTQLSKLLVPTLRDIPKEAEVVSHQLLVRGGYIRQVASGIYNLLPLMYRVVHKINTIVREELDAVGCQELLMPIMQPADLWHQSQRWEAYGPELIRLKDRHERDCVLGPTHEEVITAIAGQNINSYKQLPMNLYQIQLKFRDERRPRFGLLRGREFMMKDAYSFHADEDCLEAEYQRMATAYTRIFDRCGLDTVMVRSDSGAIGGSVSHEFMVLTNIAEGEQESGENVVFFCDECDYAANSERAESIAQPKLRDGSDIFPKEEVVPTPHVRTIEELSALLGCEPSLICKSIIYKADDDRYVMAVIRGDLDIEETKLKNAVAANNLELASKEEIKEKFGLDNGFIGPYNGEYHLLKDKILYTPSHSIENDGYTRVTGSISTEDIKKSFELVFDNSINKLEHFVISNNKINEHIVGFNFSDHIKKNFNEISQDIRLTQVNDFCPQCYEEGKHSKIKQTRGIEVGNIFKLGTKYSEVMNAKFATEDGKEAPFTMGCYGIGTTRTAAAAVERYHDANGIIWPMAIAPYHAIVIPVNTKDDAQNQLANKVYDALKANGLDVVIDDRKERAGVKFNDADLIGYPIRITAGKKAAEGLLECKMRDESTAKDLAFDDAIAWALEQYTSWKPTIQ